MNLLLINDKIPSIDFITSNLLNTQYVLFNQSTDTYQSLIEKIPLANYKNVGILQDNPFTDTYTFLDSFGLSILKNVSTVDQGLSSWENFISLVNYFKILGVKGLQFIQCNDASISNDWNYLKNKIFESLDIVISFSFNITGLGGDWILESDNLNLVGLYFTEGILGYQHTLGVATQSLGMFPPPYSFNDGGFSFMMIINNNKEVICWGCNFNFNSYFQTNESTYGSFGTKSQSQYWDNAPLNYLVYNDNGNSYYKMDVSNIISLACNYTSSAVVKNNGLVIENGTGVLSGFSNIDTSNNIVYNYPIPAVKVSSNADYIFILDASGNVYCAGKIITSQYAKEALGINAEYVNTNGLIQVTLPEKIKNIYCSSNISIFLGISGTIYTCGNEYLGDNPYGHLISSPNGSLGIPTATDNKVSVPTKLKTVEGIDITTKFKCVSTSYAHTFAIDISGNIWGWGSMYTNFYNNTNNTNYTLIGYTPTRITYDTVFKEISTSYSHTVAIDVNNNLWSWGSNTYGQLGNGTTNSTFNSTPTMIGEIKLYQINDSITQETTISNIQTQLNNSLTVNDIYTLLSGNSIISYIGNYQYWGQSTVGTYESIDNKTSLKLSTFNYIGWQFPSINFNNNNELEGKIYMALWTNVPLILTFNVVNIDIKGYGDSTEYRTIITTNGGSWTYVDVNISDFVFFKGNNSVSKQTIFSNIKQFLFANISNATNILYVQYIALKRTSNYYIKTVKPHNIVTTSIGFTTIGYLESNGDLLMASCGRNGTNKLRDPYDTVDIRPKFTIPSSNAPILYNPYPFISSLSTNSGTPGSSITINGKSLLGLVRQGDLSSTTVKFGNVQGNITSVTDTSLTVTVPNGISGSGPLIVTNSDGDSNNNTYGSKTFTINIPIQSSTNICFLAGTPIQTDQGKVEIEKININKHTIHKQKIIAITKTKNETDDTLVLFQKNSIAKNYPKKDTIISRRHKILYNGLFKEAQEYINETTIYEIKYNDEILYNVLLDKYSTMKVNNLICETLHPENKVALFYKQKIKEGIPENEILIQFKKIV